MTAEVIDRPTPASTERELPASATTRVLAWLPMLLGGALLTVILYAVFDHGAVGLAPAARVEVAVAVIAAVAAAAWLGMDALRFRAPPIAIWGLVLLGAFVFWSGVTVLWSVAPDQTWSDVNRGLSYVVVVALGIAIGMSQPRAPALLTRGFLLIAAAVAVYALGQKLVPGLHVSDVFDLNLAGSIPRLQEPIGYWNALALFLVLGVPAALALAIDPAQPPGRRLLGAAILQLLFLAIGLTLSRGGFIALAVALVIGVAGTDRRLPALAWLGLVALATVPPLVLGLTLHSLADAGVSLDSRESGGAILAGVLIASLAGLYLGGRTLMGHEAWIRGSAVGERWVRRASRAGLAALVVSALLVGLLTHAWHDFTSPAAPNNFTPSRLLTTDSYRWLWWKEAGHAFAARPVGGWGAGSFGVVHLIYRQNTLPVQQPHSVPLQFLSETGVIGAVLGLGGLTLLLVAAVRSARRRELSPAERGAAMALLGGAAAYFVHLLYDWDWDIPAVTLPVLLFIGVLVGSGRVGPRNGRESARQPLSLGTRVIAISGVTIWLCLFVVSALLPSLAASDSGAALVEASSSSRTALADAQAQARQASSLDPLSDAGLRAEASIALHRGALATARYDLERAVGREPSDELAWNELAGVDSLLGDRVAARQAARRVVALDPHGSAARALRRSNLAGYGQ